MSHPLVRRFLPSFAAVLILGLVAWRLTGSPSPSSAASSPTAAAMRRPAILSAPASELRAPGAAPTSPVTAPPAIPPTAAPAPATAAPVAPALAHTTTSPTPAALAVPADPAASTEGLKDRTGGWGKAIARQLNTELMPLASECIDLAQARNPGLAGMLIVELTLAPAGTDRAIVEAVKPATTNEIHDAELLECLRQSSFALEELKSAYNFTLSIPIKAVVLLKAS